MVGAPFWRNKALVTGTTNQEHETTASSAFPMQMTPRSFQSFSIRLGTSEFTDIYIQDLYTHACMFSSSRES